MEPREINRTWCHFAPPPQKQKPGSLPVVVFADFQVVVVFFQDVHRLQHTENRRGGGSHVRIPLRHLQPDTEHRQEWPRFALDERRHETRYTVHDACERASEILGAQNGQNVKSGSGGDGCSCSFLPSDTVESLWGCTVH